MIEETKQSKNWNSREVCPQGPEHLLSLKIKVEPKGEETRKKREKEGRLRTKWKVYSNLLKPSEAEAGITGGRLRKQKPWRQPTGAE